MLKDALNIMIVDDEPGRAVMLEEALSHLGHSVVRRRRNNQSIYQMVEVFQPDVVIVDTQSPDRDVLEDLALINNQNPKPILVLSEQSDQEIVTSAIKAGASAYIVDGLPSQKVNSVLNIAITRFNEFQALKRELVEVRSELEEQKLIDRAKRLLIKHKRIDESKAYESLRKLAMNKNKRVVDVAADVVELFA